MKKQAQQLIDAANKEQRKAILDEVAMITVDEAWRADIAKGSNLTPIDKLVHNAKALDALCQRLGIPEGKIIHRFSVTQILIARL